MLFSIASAIAVYKSTFKSLLNNSFSSFIFSIFARSSSTTLIVSFVEIGSGFLFAQDASVKARNIRIKNFKLFI